MYRGILDLLRCPVCKGCLSLTDVTSINEEIVSGKLCCSEGHVFNVIDGVIDFKSKEHEFANRWSDDYIANDFEEVDNQIELKTQDNFKRLKNMAKSTVSDILIDLNPRFILDAASGRGELLLHLVKSLNENSHIISTDLSLDVLKYDRIKVNKLKSNAKVTYIACDAANIPLKNESIDAAVSFYGVMNMMDKMQSGINEVRRVLKLNRNFINIVKLIKMDSPTYKAVSKFAVENNIEIEPEIFTYGGVVNCHKAAGFSNIGFKLIGEGMGEKNSLDLIPQEGDWFGVGNLYCWK